MSPKEETARLTAALQGRAAGEDDEGAKSTPDERAAAFAYVWHMPLPELRDLAQSIARRDPTLEAELEALVVRREYAAELQDAQRRVAVTQEAFRTLIPEDIADTPEGAARRREIVDRVWGVPARSGTPLPEADEDAGEVRE